MANGFEEKLAAQLEEKFPDDQARIAEVAQRVQKAREYDYTDHLGLDDVDSVASGIETWSQGQGMSAGWNRWIGVGVPDTDTTHLTV